MKKVFRIWKMLEQDLKEELPETISNIQDSILCLKDGWAVVCDGKTVEECAELEYIIDDSWLVEEE